MVAHLLVQHFKAFTSFPLKKKKDKSLCHKFHTVSVPETVQAAGAVLPQNRGALNISLKVTFCLWGKKEKKKGSTYPCCAQSVPLTLKTNVCQKEAVMMDPAILSLNASYRGFHCVSSQQSMLQTLPAPNFPAAIKQHNIKRGMQLILGFSRSLPVCKHTRGTLKHCVFSNVCL